jgi:hypothetical protein
MNSYAQARKYLPGLSLGRTSWQSKRFTLSLDQGEEGQQRNSCDGNGVAQAKPFSAALPQELIRAERYSSVAATRPY